MSGIDKKACRQFLESGLAPNSDCGLFLVPKLKYIIRTSIKNVGHRHLLILCLYAKGNTPGDRPRLAYTMFQASNSFVTYDHQPDTKTVWWTAMLENRVPLAAPYSARGYAGVLSTWNFVSSFSMI